MGKEPRVRLRKFPLPATQDPYSFHIRMAALRKKFQEFGLKTAPLSSPKPSSARRVTRNSLGDGWFPTEETLLRAPKKSHGQGVWTCKLVKNKPRVRLSFSSVNSLSHSGAAKRRKTLGPPEEGLNILHRYGL